MKICSLPHSSTLLTVLASPLGIEPRITGSKPVVIPFHHELGSPVRIRTLTFSFRERNTSNVRGNCKQRKKCDGCFISLSEVTHYYATTWSFLQESDLYLSIIGRLLYHWAKKGWLILLYSSFVRLLSYCNYDAMITEVIIALLDTISITRFGITKLGCLLGTAPRLQSSQDWVRTSTL